MTIFERLGLAFLGFCVTLLGLIMVILAFCLGWAVVGQFTYFESTPYQQGVKAYNSGVCEDSNPYKRYDNRDLWSRGWQEAHDLRLQSGQISIVDQ